MFVVVVNGRKDGKIELTKAELQRMLDDAYEKGRSDQREADNRWPYTFTTPAYIYNDSTTIPSDKITITCS